MENISLSSNNSIQTNNLLHKKQEVSSDCKQSISEELKQKAKNMAGATALAAMIMGGMGVTSCSTDDYLGENEQIKTEMYSADTQKTVSIVAENFKNARTPQARLDILRNELGIGTGNTPPAYDIYGANGDAKDHNPTTYTIQSSKPDEVLISAVQVDFGHTSSGVEYASRITNGDDGSLNITRVATGGDLSGQTHGPVGFDHKGAVENISIKANDDGSFTEEKVDANGNKTTYTIAKDNEGYYRMQDGTNVKERFGTEERAVPITFDATVEDWDSVTY